MACRIPFPASPFLEPGLGLFPEARFYFSPATKGLIVTRLYIDLETRSSVPITSGAYKYAESPDFEVLIWAWATDEGAVLTEIGPAMPVEIHSALNDPEVVIVAHNAQFERVCMSRTYDNRDLDGEYFLTPEKFDDTMARASINGLPGSLDNLAKALKVPVSKDSAGTRLINKFSVPPFTAPEDSPEDFEKYVLYCARDVEVLRQVDQALPDWPEGEYGVWCLDQRINDRGIAVDIELATACVEAASTNFIVDEIEVMHLTGVSNPASVQQMSAWLKAKPGLEDLENLQASTVEKLLESADLNAETREVLTRRLNMSATSTKKHNAMVAWAGTDGRSRGNLHYAAAHTGRWGGRGWQPQNLPRDSFADNGERDEAIKRVLSGEFTPTETLKKLVRPCWEGPLTIVDFNAIEARITAWLAGEEWMLQAFRDGRDIYVETADRSSTPTQKFDRQEGKQQVLGLGFAGAVGALRKMGAQGTDEELLTLVRAYRDINPKTVELWNELERALTRGKGSEVGAGHIRTERRRTKAKTINARLFLPSGRTLTYRNIKQESVLSVDPDTGEEVRKLAWRFTDYRTGSGARTKLWRGSATENAVQATARDIQAHALLRLEAEGLPVVGHVHDEVVIEGEHDVDEIAGIMCDLPDWSEGLPMAAEGEVVDRYAKG